VKRGLLIGGIVALLGAAGIWFLSNFDRVPVRQWTGYTGEARRNPLLALERMATRLGADARELRSVAQLGELPPNGVLVLPSRRDNVTEPVWRRLLEWVSGGGRLVVEAEPFGLDDPLLEALGIVRGRPTAPAPGAGPPPRPSYLWPGDDKPLATTLFPYPALSHPQAVMALAWNRQNAVVAITHGKGRITAVSSLGFARNAAIGGAQNASLAWRLVGSGDAPIVFLNRPERLSLWQWLVRNAWPALAGAALLVLLWLARIVPRFGPIAPDAPPVRRRLLDHLRAVGRFHWSTRRAAHLVDAAREGALRRLARARPNFASATPREREQLLVEAFALSPEEARIVVTGQFNTRSQADLVRAIALFQSIHERAAARRD
jgi:hypothetical protein